jgi:hypothetical protein
MGFDFAKNIRQIKSDIKVLLMTLFEVEKFQQVKKIDVSVCVSSVSFVHH